MTMLDAGDLHLHYEIEGDGVPILLIAPGGMRSANNIWERMPWNPRTALVDSYRLIGMDQRNAGSSTAPVSRDDDWGTYAADQLAFLDHLGIDRCHVLGMCIGGPYIAGLLRAAPQRFLSAVILQPVGIDANRPSLEQMFDAWAEDLSADHPHMDAAAWQSFRSNMWDGEFLLAASLEDMAAVQTPMLVMMGDDIYHPESTSRELAAAAPNARLIERWQDDDVLADTNEQIRSFLDEHSPT
jgi:pimeloyl-ACP methyl ester carboxylesterase